MWSPGCHTKAFDICPKTKGHCSGSRMTESDLHFGKIDQKVTGHLPSEEQFHLSGGGRSKTEDLGAGERQCR